MTTFPILLLAHLIADFPLQTNRIYILKTQGNKGLLFACPHPYADGGGAGAPAVADIPLFVVLGAIHFVVDWLKLNKPAVKQTPGFLLDQLAHVLTILLLTIWQPHLASILPLWVISLGIVWALIPALLTSLWVLATDLQIASPDNPTLTWANHWLLPISQKVGSLCVVSLVVIWVLVIV
ncbi:MAG: DUF3307 domain-containing protein [bacterium]|nr:DUF3307 domain-containing protein [bacterium]